MAEQGYFVLAARCRNSIDEELIIKTLESELGRKLKVENLFCQNSKYMPKINSALVEKIIWTHAMCRMVILCSEAWKHKEAALMVGETGCGKTTAAHVLV